MDLGVHGGAHPGPPASPGLGSAAPRRGPRHPRGARPAPQHVGPGRETAVAAAARSRRPIPALEVPRVPPLLGHRSGAGGQASGPRGKQRNGAPPWERPLAGFGEGGADTLKVPAEGRKEGGRGGEAPPTKRGSCQTAAGEASREVATAPARRRLRDRLSRGGSQFRAAKARRWEPALSQSGAHRTRGMEGAGLRGEGLPSEAPGRQAACVWYRILPGVVNRAPKTTPEVSKRDPWCFFVGLRAVPPLPQFLHSPETCDSEELALPVKKGRAQGEASYSGGDFIHFFSQLGVVS